jgi:hypothetical protein
VNGQTKKLVQWLRDFADGNGDSFEADLLARLHEAADAITVLDEAVDSLIVERDAAYDRIDALKEGFEGCCTACEPVALQNTRLLQELQTLKGNR